MKIFINGEEREVEGTTISYEQAVEWARTGSSALHSVTYYHRVPTEMLPGERNGMLSPGQSVRMTVGMSVQAVVTGAA